jgi:hypothetical protein
MHTHPAPADAGVGTGASQPALRVAEIFRRHGAAFRAAHVLTPQQSRVLSALSVCRTEALGGHLEVCDDCGFTRPVYNSCRDRHCPGCQATAQHAWVQGRLRRVLNTHHFHVVFTLPAELRDLALRNGVVVYNALHRAAAWTLDTLARQRLGAQLGVTAVLHTWTREMLFHPHIHCVVTGGGLSPDGTRWVATSPRYLFPVAVLRKLWSRRVRDLLQEAYDQGALDLGGACTALANPPAFQHLLRGLSRKHWVVYCKPPFAGPEAVFAYLGRYTHRVAISDHRLRAMTETTVTFATKEGGQVTVTPEEFVRRFLLHVLPPGFHKIRHLGLYAGANVQTRLAAARALLPALPPRPADPPFDADDDDADDDADPLARFLHLSHRCPSCGARALRVRDLPRRSTTPPPLDTS